MTPIHSCVYKDVRFIRQFVFNWPVAPYVDPATPLDGQPRRHMQRGQEYECIECGHVLAIPFDERDDIEQSAK
jgi:hypothetical protein